jgi:hypothetical protein
VDTGHLHDESATVRLHLHDASDQDREVGL